MKMPDQVGGVDPAAVLALTDLLCQAGSVMSDMSVLPLEEGLTCDDATA